MIIWNIDVNIKVNMLDKKNSKYKMLNIAVYRLLNIVCSCIDLAKYSTGV